MRAVVDLPEPDSPTSARVWPRGMSNEMPSTARMPPSNVFARSRAVTSGSAAGAAGRSVLVMLGAAASSCCV